jgi:CubicO group peptidase (beta-lactamase class C family)
MEPSGPGDRAGSAVTAAVACLAVVASLAPGVGSPPVRAADPETPVIDRFRAEIPKLMADQGVPGLAVAVVDRSRAVWVEGFGHLDGPDSPAVTTDTAFSVQSMSKVFTATAVMLAVQHGLVDLDVPITTYVPAFTVHSAFEADPERKMTLRMLLAHTAGFTLEAPIGNNNSIEPGTFDDHVRSISDTWLRYPVGQGYAYSNLDIDLAGYILERVTGKPFDALMADTLLAPVGMAHSTFDRTAIRATANRAIGHMGGVPAWQLDMPMTAAGGLYASASDLARFLSFQVDDGSIDGVSVLDPALLAQMRTIPSPNARAGAGYALGVSRTRWRAERGQDLFMHGGGGFGFLSDLWWCPSIGIGIAVLTSSSDHQLQETLAISIMRAFVDEPGSVFGERLATLPAQADVIGDSVDPQLPSGYSAVVAAAAMPTSQDEAARLAPYVGAYNEPSWGLVSPFVTEPDRILVEDGVPSFETADTGSVLRHALTEIRPGLYLADNGEVLDLRVSPPTWRNLELSRAQLAPYPWQAALMALVAIVALGWLVAGILVAIRRRRPDRIDRVGEGARARPGGIVLLLGVLTMVAILACVALVAAIPGLVDAGFVGWIAFPLPARAVFHLPLAIAVLATALGVVVAGAWLRRSWATTDLVRYGALATAAIALALQLAAWRMIGWGF